MERGQAGDVRRPRPLRVHDGGGQGLDDEFQGGCCVIARMALLSTSQRSPSTYTKHTHTITSGYGPITKEPQDSHKHDHVNTRTQCQFTIDLVFGVYGGYKLRTICFFDVSFQLLTVHWSIHVSSVLQLNRFEKRTTASDSFVVCSHQFLMDFVKSQDWWVWPQATFRADTCEILEDRVRRWRPKRKGYERVCGGVFRCAATGRAP